MSWRVANSLGATALDGLLGEINASAPNRSKASDGSIGDAAHSASTSDHNPCACHAVVCARDFTHDPKGGFDSYFFADWLAARVVKDEPRVKYIISNRRICSGQGQSDPAGVWRPYTGKNPHDRHVHVSVRHPLELFDGKTTWGWSTREPAGLAEPALPVPEEFPALPAPDFPLPDGHWYGPESKDAKNHSGYWPDDQPWIRYLILTLRARGWPNAVDDDIFTKAFKHQVQAFQVQQGITADGLVGSTTFEVLHTALR
jgi:hypothetical protein